MMFVESSKYKQYKSSLRYESSINRRNTYLATQQKSDDGTVWEKENGENTVRELT